ncbi:glycosyltransferase family 4 protein [Microbulbifer sp. SAOS-129_SWC]|uniref:glycosyltransferase family 4 protein n=1 Tax=Microbulbifer sp. SAOS-129_SWC TaxID=3145235 RepID=UPI003216AEED
MILIATQNFPPDRGGIENLMGGLADNLAAAGLPLEVYADRVRSAGEERPRGYPVHRFGGARPWRRRCKARAIKEAVRKGGVRGIFADSWKSSELLTGLGVPVVVLAHGMEFPHNPGAWKRERIGKALASTRTVIANSAYTASLVQPYVGEVPLTVINPPIDPQPQPDPQQVAALRSLVAGRGPVLMTLARLEPRKGVDTVIGALADIRRQFPQVLYIVAGGGDDRARLEKLAADRGVADCVVFAGMVDDEKKAALFSLVDLFVMPARREGDSVEGFGIVYREAGWYGVPALAGREGGAADAVIDGQTGLLCDADSQADVTAQILRLLEDAQLRRQLGENAARLARDSGQWRVSVQRFVEALR